MTTITAPVADSRARILAAALGVFAESGFSGATTREIARRAKVHQPAIAYHFRNKEDLWKVAVDHVFTSFQHALEAASACDEDRERRVRAIVSMFLRYVAANPEWFAFVIHEGQQTNVRSRYVVDRWLAPQSRMLFEALTGECWPADPADSAYAVSLLGIVTGAASVFAQRIQIDRIAGLDVCGGAFLALHVDMLTATVCALAPASH